MSKEFLVLKRETLIDIADAIRLKTGNSNPIAIDDLDEAVENIQPTGTLVVTENGEYDVSNYAKVIINVIETVYKTVYLAKTVADNYTGFGDYRIAKYPKEFNNISPDFEQNRISYIDLPTDGAMTEIKMEVGYVYILTDDNYDEYVKGIYINGSSGYPTDETWGVWPYEGSYTCYGAILMKADGTINPEFTENGEHTIYMTYD